MNALRNAEDLLAKTTDTEERFRLRLKIVELHRRRSAHGELEKAVELFKELSTETEVPTDLKSWFHYEAGYIQLLLGHHDNARREFQASLCALDKEEKHWPGRWSAATSLLVETTIACEGTKAPFCQLRKMLEEALGAARRARELHGKRWVLNCLLHLTNLSLAEGDTRIAQEKLERAIDHWQTMSVAEGWDQAFRPTVLAVTGKVLAANARGQCDAEKALKYLTRALVGILWQGENLAGSRDVLFATARMLDRASEDAHARRVQDIASRVRDGASWVSPYRAAQ